MLDNKEIYSPMYGCSIPINNYRDKEIKQHEMKLLHKDIIELADKLYRFSDSLEMNNKEELGIQKSIFEALQNLNNVTEYLTKHTLSGE